MQIPARIGGRKRAWSAARKTTIDGITFPSATEARVYARLRTETRPGERLYRQVRMPLLSSAPDASGVPYSISIDFVLVGGARHADSAVEVARRLEPQLAMAYASGATNEQITATIATEIAQTLRRSAAALLGGVRFIDAKTGRKSREWPRGKAAFEATWGRLEETDR